MKSCTEELIQKIPEEFQELARAHLPLFNKMSDEELMSWIDYIMAGDYMKAYEIAGKKMRLDERIQEQKRMKQLLKDISISMRDREEVMAKFFKQLLLIIISAIRWK